MRPNGQSLGRWLEPRALEGSGAKTARWNPSGESMWVVPCRASARERTGGRRRLARKYTARNCKTQCFPKEPVFRYLLRQRIFNSQGRIWNSTNDFKSYFLSLSLSLILLKITKWGAEEEVKQRKRKNFLPFYHPQTMSRAQTEGKRRDSIKCEMEDLDLVTYINT